MTVSPPWLAVAALAALALPLAGCLMHTSPSLPTTVQQSPEAPAAASDPFPYERREVLYKNAILGNLETDRYHVRHVRFPSVGNNGQPDNLVRGFYYESKLPGRKPLVVVLPIWGGHSYPSDKIAARIRRASRGRAHVFLVSSEGALFDWKGLANAEDQEAFFELWRHGVESEEAMIVDVRRIIDWAEARDDVDAGRIGLVGFSASAVLAATIATTEERLEATVVVMGGGLIHESLARCPLRRSDGMRRRAADFGWSPDDLAERLEPLARPVDPISYPGRVDPERVLIIEATKDKCFSKEGRTTLFEALGRPERIEIRATHKGAFLALSPLALNRLRGHIWDFLDRRLRIMEDAPSSG